MRPFPGPSISRPSGHSTELGGFAFTGFPRSRLMVVEPHCASGADLLRLAPEKAKRLKELEAALAETAQHVGTVVGTVVAAAG